MMPLAREISFLAERATSKLETHMISKWAIGK